MLKLPVYFSLWKALIILIDNMDISTFVLRLMAALLAGAAIGFERQWHHKKAGLRTNTLVAIGAAIYVLISVQMVADGGDVTRIIGQVVVGVGFLGAGVILHQGLEVQGLTTAATIWCSSAIGCLAGAGYFNEVIVCTLTIIIVNAILQKVDIWMGNRKAQKK